MSVSPIGLFFATLVAILLATGQVFNKKVVEGQNVSAAVFWIRLFAAGVFAIVLSGYAMIGAPPMIHPPSALESDDIRNVPSLVAQLKTPANPAVRRVVNGLPQSTQHELANYKAGDDSKDLSKSLRDGLNGAGVLQGALLYQPADLTSVTLSAETTRVLSAAPHNQVQAYANRLILEDLFHGAIGERRTVALFGVKGILVRPLTAFSVYLLFEVILVVWAQWLNSRALQISPISLCVPFTSFGPIFMLGTGYLVLGELPTTVGLLGVALIVIGGLLMHRRLFAGGGRAFVRAISKEKGSQFMLLSVMITAVFVPIEKQLILMSDSVTALCAYGIGTVIAFWLICKVKRVDVMQVMRKRPKAAVLSGLSDAFQMLAQFIAVVYLPVVITMCIKRAGIVLTVLAGWLIFKERDIHDRIIGASAMLGGVILFYLPLQLSQALTLTGAVLIGLIAALYMTRNSNRMQRPAEESVEPVNN